MIRVVWNEDEIVLLLDLYYSLHGLAGLRKDNEHIVALSRLLNERADLRGIVRDEKFRNLIGIFMQLQNVEYLATDGVGGLSDVGALQRTVFENYVGKVQQLRERAAQLTLAIENGSYV